MSKPVAEIEISRQAAKRVASGHPWVFPKGASSAPGDLPAGTVVRLRSGGEFVGVGLFNPASLLRIRVYRWDDGPLDDAFFRQRLRDAVAFRETLGLGDRRAGCRLVYSESDGLSGLVVDRFGDAIVVQVAAAAIVPFLPAIVAELETIFQPSRIDRRVDPEIARLEGMSLGSELLRGQESDEPVVIVENGVEMGVDLSGQKTGYFLDQRDNRAAVARFASGRRVLDVFCYTGGFAIAASKAGAASVRAIDSSADAIALAGKNATRNGCEVDFVRSDAAAELERLARGGERFGLVVCDPPKFASKADDVAAALRGYEFINRRAIEVLEPGGILASFSCSGHVSGSELLEAIDRAAARLGRRLVLLESRGQPADHPVLVACPETAYLKCLILRVR